MKKNMNAQNKARIERQSRIARPEITVEYEATVGKFRWAVGIRQEVMPQSGIELDGKAAIIRIMHDQTESEVVVGLQSVSTGAARLRARKATWDSKAGKYAYSKMGVLLQDKVNALEPLIKRLLRDATLFDGSAQSVTIGPKTDAVDWDRVVEIEQSDENDIF